MEHLILRHRRAPGDILMLTAALRDLHRQYPKRFKTDIRTPFEQIWTNNPYITPLNEAIRGTRNIDCDYPDIHQSDQKPDHFIGAFHRFLANTLELPLEVSEFRADIHLTQAEKDFPPFSNLLPPTYWLISAGGKRDFTIKWWDRKRFQRVVDHFRGQVTFVQVGAAGIAHPHGARELDADERARGELPAVRRQGAFERLGLRLVDDQLRERRRVRVELTHVGRRR